MLRFLRKLEKKNVVIKLHVHSSINGKKGVGAYCYEEDVPQKVGWSSGSTTFDREGWSNGSIFYVFVGQLVLFSFNMFEQVPLLFVYKVKGVV